jgi:hypothetical protein
MKPTFILQHTRNNKSLQYAHLCLPYSRSLTSDTQSVRTEYPEKQRQERKRSLLVVYVMPMLRAGAYPEEVVRLTVCCALLNRKVAVLNPRVHHAFVGAMW